DRPAQATHQGCHFGPDCKLPAGTGLDHADAFDAADVRDLGPLTLAHVHLGVVDAERLHLDHDVARLGLGLRDLPNFQHVGPAELLPENRTHEKSSNIRHLRSVWSIYPNAGLMESRSVGGSEADGSCLLCESNRSIEKGPGPARTSASRPAI